MASRNFGAGWKMFRKKYPIAQLVAMLVATFSALHSFWLAKQLNDLQAHCGDKNSRR